MNPQKLTPVSPVSFRQINRLVGSLDEFLLTLLEAELSNAETAGQCLYNTEVVLLYLQSKSLGHPSASVLVGRRQKNKKFFPAPTGQKVFFAYACSDEP